MFAKEQSVRSHGALEIGFADVVDVDPAALDVFSRLALGRTESGVNEQFDQRHTTAVKPPALDFLGRDFTYDFVKSGFGNAFEIAAEKNFAGADGFRRGARAVNQLGDRLGERFVRDPSFFRLSVQGADGWLVE